MSSSTVSAGKQPSADDSFLDGAAAIVNKIKETASNVTVCQAQIDIVHDRCTLLLEGILTASATMTPERLKETVLAAEALFKKIHSKLLQAAIYGRAKSFILRQEVSAYLESFNLEIESCATSFRESAPEELFDWQGDFIQARALDEIEALNSIESIINNPADFKLIFTLGQSAIDNFQEAIQMALLSDGITKLQISRYRRCLDRLLEHANQTYTASEDPPAFEFLPPEAGENPFVPIRNLDHRGKSREQEPPPPPPEAEYYPEGVPSERPPSFEASIIAGTAGGAPPTPKEKS